MNSYGGYTRADDGGGFVSGTQQGSQAQGGARTYNDQTLRPVTIKQLHDCTQDYPDAEIMMDGAPLHQVTLVGQIRQINPQATNITYRLDDGTELIDVKKWIDPEKADDADPKFEQDQFVQVWGKLKFYNDRKHVGAHFIRAVEDYNAVTCHMLEAAYVHLYFEKMAKGMMRDGGGPGGMHDGGGDGMFVEGTMGAGEGSEIAKRLRECKPRSVELWNILKNAPTSDGLSLHELATRSSWSHREVLAGTDDLLAHGVVYTTVDDETWAVLDY